MSLPLCDACTDIRCFLFAGGATFAKSHVFANLHNKRRYVCLSVCLLPMAGRTAGPIKTKLGIGIHVDPGSVSVKVKVIYLCVRYNRIHACATWRITMNHAQISSSSSSIAVTAATWWMLMKLLTEACKGRENSSAKHDNFFQPEDGYLQLVTNIKRVGVGGAGMEVIPLGPDEANRWVRVCIHAPGKALEGNDRQTDRRKNAITGISSTSARDIIIINHFLYPQQKTSRHEHWSRRNVIRLKRHRTQSSRRSETIFMFISCLQQ